MKNLYSGNWIGHRPSAIIFELIILYILALLISTNLQSSFDDLQVTCPWRCIQPNQSGKSSSRTQAFSIKKQKLMLNSAWTTASNALLTYQRTFWRNLDLYNRWHPRRWGQQDGRMACKQLKAAAKTKTTKKPPQVKAEMAKPEYRKFLVDWTAC